MFPFWIVAFCLIVFYYIWIGRFYYGWLKTPAFNTLPDINNKTASIIVPVRNEEDNIRTLLDDLAKQDYPQKFIEIIIIDDHSSDLTPDIVKDRMKHNDNIRYVKLSDNEGGKKSALHMGVNLSRFPLIITTDADCRPSSSWVKTMVDCFETTGADLIAGPVLMKGDEGFFSKFQQLEFFSLLGTTAGALFVNDPVMCSSANLGFKKEAYLEVRNPRFENPTSGDDVFLLLAMKNSGKKKLVFLKTNLGYIQTKVQSGINEFLQQRKRWASKSRYYNTKASVFTALLVFAINFYTLIILFAGLINSEFLFIAACIFILKSMIDFPFLYSITRYFREENLMKIFIASQFVYFFYISYTAISAFTGVFKWKGRIVKY